MKLTVNGNELQINSDEDTPLLWVLRDELNMVGTKFGCGIAQCGACTVHLSGVALRSCSLPVAAVANQKVTTIEGLAAEGMAALQDAWIEQEVPQCGYCQVGQIMTAAALLKANPKPSEQDLDEGMNNLCRCGTYNRIRKAIHQSAKTLPAAAPAQGEAEPTPEEPAP